jgi:hypothetical protein
MLDDIDFVNCIEAIRKSREAEAEAEFTKSSYLAIDRCIFQI